MHDEFDDLRPPLGHVGRELVDSAENFDPSPSLLLRELFPYVWLASRRMSTRQISAWLKEHHAIQISQATVSRSLRNPEKYWEAFSAYIEPAARIVGEALDMDINDLLYPEDDGLFDHFTHDAKPLLTGNDDDELRSAFSEYEGAVKFLKAEWFALSGQARSQCWKYFQDEPETEDAK